MGATARIQNYKLFNTRNVRFETFLQEKRCFPMRIWQRLAVCSHTPALANVLPVVGPITCSWNIHTNRCYDFGRQAGTFKSE